MSRFSITSSFLRVTLAGMILFLPMLRASESAAETSGVNGISSAAEETSDDGFTPGIIPAAAAALPGFFVHGAGHWAAGDSSTAKELLIAEGTGAGLFLSGIALLAATGAGERSSAPAIGMAAAGAGLFFNSYFADIYGSSGAGEPNEARDPDLLFNVGYSRLSDPLFECRNLFEFSARAGSHGVGIEPFYFTSLDDGHVFGGGRIYWRFWDDGEGSFAKIKGGATYRDNPSEYFSIRTGEIWTEGRFDHGLISPSLAGSFSEFQFGFARAWYGYDVPGYRDWSESNDIYILRTAFGFRFGPHGGEALVFYNHRRDQYAGGMSGGFMGAFGARIEFFPIEHLGCYAEFIAGSSYESSFGMTLRR